MHQQFYYRLARLVSKIEINAVNVFLSFYENQAPIPFYL